MSDNENRISSFPFTLLNSVFGEYENGYIEWRNKKRPDVEFPPDLLATTLYLIHVMFPPKVTRMMMMRYYYDIPSQEIASYFKTEVDSVREILAKSLLYFRHSEVETYLLYGIKANVEMRVKEAELLFKKQHEDYNYRILKLMQKEEIPIMTKELVGIESKAESEPMLSARSEETNPTGIDTVSEDKTAKSAVVAMMNAEYVSPPKEVKEPEKEEKQEMPVSEKTDKEKQFEKQAEKSDEKKPKAKAVSVSSMTESLSAKTINLLITNGFSNSAKIISYANGDYGKFKAFKGFGTKTCEEIQRAMQVF